MYMYVYIYIFIYLHISYNIIITIINDSFIVITTPVVGIVVGYALGHLAPATEFKGDVSKSVAGVAGNFEALGDMDFSWRR